MKIFSETKWRIIKELSEGDKSPTELARILKMSVPAVYNQLVELERLKLISKVGGKEGKTRPYQQYSLGDGFLFFIKAMPNETEKRFIDIDKNMKLHFRIWSIPQQEFHYAVESFLWDLKPKLSKIDAIAVFGSVARGDAKKDSDIDLLILSKKNIKINAKMIEGKMFMPQVFETDDFKNAVRKKSKFANEILKDIIILYDLRGILKDVKRRAG
jgi:predicted nucleotidyltransferase/DNA-binding HxlR family transcriptional regulator